MNVSRRWGVLGLFVLGVLVGMASGYFFQARPAHAKPPQGIPQRLDVVEAEIAILFDQIKDLQAQLDECCGDDCVSEKECGLGDAKGNLVNDGACCHLPDGTPGICKGGKCIPVFKQ
jgi:hypothetical protein